MAPDREEIWPADTTPHIRVVRVNVQPNVIAFGNQVKITVVVKNTGDAKGTENVRCKADKVDTVFVASYMSLLQDQVQLNPDEEKIYTIDWKPDEGSYVLEAEPIDSYLIATLTVGPAILVPPPVEAPLHGPHLRVICLLVFVPIAVNKTCRLSAVVENKGDTAGTRKVVTTVTGPAAPFTAESTATVPAQEQQLVYWDGWKPTGAGTYQWTVEQLTVSLDVKP